SKTIGPVTWTGRSRRTPGCCALASPGGDLCSPGCFRGSNISHLVGSWARSLPGSTLVPDFRRPRFGSGPCGSWWACHRLCKPLSCHSVVLAEHPGGSGAHSRTTVGTSLVAGNDSIGSGASARSFCARALSLAAYRPLRGYARGSL